MSKTCLSANSPLKKYITRHSLVIYFFCSAVKNTAYSFTFEKRCFCFSASF